MRSLVRSTSTWTRSSSVFRPRRSSSPVAKHLSTQSPETDDCAIPLRHTWSVRGLLSSYPTPSISPETLDRLHHLSALIPPAPGTGDHSRLTRELEDLVKLVEAVRLVNLKDHASDGATIPDGRVNADNASICLDERVRPPEDEIVMDSKALLSHASQTSQGFYMVDVARPHSR